MVLVLLPAVCLGSTADWIVRFDEYKSVAAHFRSVGRVLGPAGRVWAPVHRGKRPHTDFCLIRLFEPAAGALRRMPGYRGATPERVIRKSALKRRSLAVSPRDFESEEEAREADVRRYGATVAPGKSAESLWALGFDGANASVAVFDTGVRWSAKHFRSPPVETINWTSEPTLEDKLGHGTFVASLVAGRCSECPGFAPSVKLHVHRVFTNDQISFTSWFLDAFNYVLWKQNVDVVNLSVGGPDFADAPFVDKIREVTAAGITVVSAIGNDGPTWGSLNSPADMPEVVGVGGTEAKAPDEIAKFSSRGRTLWDRRLKPDLVAPAAGVLGALVSGKCRAMHGTSVASPSVAGLAALIVSAAAISARADFGSSRNPAMVKQCLLETATPLGKPTSVYAQGAGAIDPKRAVLECAASYVPRVTAYPPALRWNECPTFSPHCEQPLFHTGMPAVANITILNGVGVAFRITRVRWTNDDDDDDDLVRVETKLSRRDGWMWPWVGALGVRATVTRDVETHHLLEGALEITVETLLGGGVRRERRDLRVPLSANVGPKPPRRKRLLWDATHSLNYPPAFAPRDSLKQQADLLDWNGDIPDTNFRSLYLHLVRDRGYAVDVLTKDFDCFDASNYGALLLVDSEDVFTDAERAKLRADVVSEGLAVFVVADWHSPALIEDAAFFDDNTQVRWTPVVGGANVPALNQLIAPFGLGIGDRVFEGSLPSRFCGGSCEFDSGNAIVRAPRGALVARATLNERKPHQPRRKRVNRDPPEDVVVLAATPKVAVFGDSGCLDDAHHSGGYYCWPLLDGVLAWLLDANRSFFPHDQQQVLHAPLDLGPPAASSPESTLFAKYSRPRAGGCDDDDDDDQFRWLRAA
ncbi:hypothetical protein CTAYLR_009501 [Chrysophaeum taylorii]|uniref:subtilisin n=1 Tax=Chrysophaeum taylorii TaxID=2483200 RepID=A0AAD7U6G5_9STRA|nr:hypothetical protein CTAYLR_009501 [Chrysophaeum taylorii]